MELRAVPVWSLGALSRASTLALALMARFRHEIAASRPFLREAELSPRVQKIYQSYIQSLERAEGKASRPLGFRFLARLAHYLTWIILPLQVAFFASLPQLLLSA